MSPYRVIAANRQVLAAWDELVRLRRDGAIRCWDHLANTPPEPIGGRYVPLKGNLAWCTFGTQRLRQWQWEVDRRARVKVAVAVDVVVIMSVSMGHPRENE